ncbi:Cytochrome P450 CYP72A219-like protein [Drosera capensis]
MEAQQLLIRTGISVACIVVFSWAWKFFNWVWVKPKSLEKKLKQQGLSGNPYRLLYGDTKEIAKMSLEAESKPMASFSNDHISRFMPFEYQTIKKHGNHSFLWFGSTPIVFICEPELIREVLNNMNVFQKPKSNPLTALLTPGFILYDGERWSRHRKLVNPAFHMEKLKLMMPAFYTSCEELLHKWEKLVPETGSCELDVWSDLTTLTADVLSRAAFSSSFEEGRKIFILLKEQSSLIVKISQSVYIPGWRFVPTRTNRRLMKVDREIKYLLKGIIQDRKHDMDVGNPAKDDLLSILMESSFKELHSHGNGNNRHVKLTVDEVVDDCKLFYFAGQETTSLLLSWIMILLGKHQDWQERAREEILATFGKDKPTFDGLNLLKIITMIVNEALRLYPPVPSLGRSVEHSINVGSFTIPAGAMVSLMFVLAHHDPKIWGEDALEFNPERFSDGISHATHGSNGFFPFGWGPRICIGQNFAMNETKLALTMILQRFSFELSPSYAHGPVVAPLLLPQYGVPIVFHRL